MKSSRWLVAGFLLLQLAASEAFFLSLGLVGIGVAGLAGLKLYYGMKMLSPMIRNTGIHAVHQRVEAPGPPPLGVHPMLSPIFRAIGAYGAPKEDVPSQESMLPNAMGEGPQKQVIFVPVVPMESNPKFNSTPASTRTRRALPGGLKINGKLFRWLAKIDDEKCIHRFFCVLGGKPREFGNLGRLTNMLVMMGGLPDDSWGANMYKLGQQSGEGACPKECKDRQLLKTVAYLERQLFETDNTSDHHHSVDAEGDVAPVLDIED